MGMFIIVIITLNAYIIRIKYIGCLEFVVSIKSSGILSFLKYARCVAALVTIKIDITTDLYIFMIL